MTYSLYNTSSTSYADELSSNSGLWKNSPDGYAYVDTEISTRTSFRDFRKFLRTEYLRAGVRSLHRILPASVIWGSFCPWVAEQKYLRTKPQWSLTILFTSSPIKSTDLPFERQQAPCKHPESSFRPNRSLRENCNQKCPDLKVFRNREDDETGTIEPPVWMRNLDQICNDSREEKPSVCSI